MVQAPVSPSPVVVQIQAQSKDLLDFAIAVIQLLTLIGLVVYVIKTWQIASATKNAAEATRRSTQLSEKVIEEMKVARTQEIAPQVIIYIDKPDNNWTLYLVAKNIGKSVAKDIQFNFDPPLMCGFGNKSHESEISFVKNGIRSLAPGQEIRVFHDVIANHFGKMAEKLDPRLPTAYRVRVTFKGGAQDESVTSDQVIDLSMFEGIGHIQEQETKDIKALMELAESSRRIRTILENLTDTVINGVPLRVPELLGALPEATVEAWKRRLFAKLSEFRMLWRTIHAGNFDKPVRLYAENLQSRSTIIASQLLLIASTAPGDNYQELVDSVTSVAVKLTQLSEKQFYMDDGESYTAFNTLGDEIAALIDQMIEKANSVGVE